MRIKNYRQALKEMRIEINKLTMLSNHTPTILEESCFVLMKSKVVMSILNQGGKK